MIIQITEDRQISGRWFLAPQQYAIVSKFDAPVSLCKSCGQRYKTQNITFYEVTVDGVNYNLPYDIVSVINKDTPSSDMRGARELWEAKVTHDITLKPGEHTDVVKQAERYLGIRMTNRKQVDGLRLAELRALKEAKGYTGGCHTEEHVQLTEQEIALAVEQAGGNVINDPVPPTIDNAILQEDGNFIFTEENEKIIQEG